MAVLTRFTRIHTPTDTASIDRGFRSVFCSSNHLLNRAVGRVVDALRVEVGTETPAQTPHLSRRVSSAV
jgi:hypothetical protein